MNRRSFVAGLAAALILPEPPRVRAYSFMPGERVKPVSINGRVYDWGSITLTLGGTLYGVKTINYSGPARDLGSYIDTALGFATQETP